MFPTQHYSEGEKLLAQAATAKDPSRLIGMAQAHFLAAQVGLQAAASVAYADDQPAYQALWESLFDTTYGPNGRPA